MCIVFIIYSCKYTIKLFFVLYFMSFTGCLLRSQCGQVSSSWRWDHYCGGTYNNCMNLCMCICYFLSLVCNTSILHNVQICNSLAICTHTLMFLWTVCTYVRMYSMYVCMYVCMYVIKDISALKSCSLCMYVTRI